MSLSEKKALLTQELKELESLKSSHQAVEEKILSLKQEIFDLQVPKLTPEKLLTTEVHLFATQSNKIKLNDFLAHYPVVRIDLSYQATNTYCLQIAFDQKKTFEEQLIQVQDFIPYLRIVPEIFTLPLKITGQHVKIKESTLGEYGIYELVQPVNKSEVWLCCSQKNVFSIIQKFPDWESSLYYVYKHHPYFK